MNMSDEIKSQIVERYGQAMLDQILSFSETVKANGKAISELGIAYKSLALKPEPRRKVDKFWGFETAPHYEQPKRSRPKIDRFWGFDTKK